MFGMTMKSPILFWRTSVEMRLKKPPQTRPGALCSWIKKVCKTAGGWKKREFAALSAVLKEKPADSRSALVPTLAANSATTGKDLRGCAWNGAQSVSDFSAFHVPYLLLALVASHLFSSHSSSRATRSYSHPIARNPLTAALFCAPVFHTFFFFFWITICSSMNPVASTSKILLKSGFLQ